MASGRDIRAGGAFVELNTKNGPFLRGLDQASRKFQSFGTSVVKVGAGITAGMAGIAGGITAAMAPLAHFSDIYLDMQNRIKATNEAAAGSTKVLNQTMSDLFDIASRARTPVESLVDLYARMSLSAKSAGLGQKSLMRIVEAVAKSSAIGGGTTQSIDAAVIQLSQILGSGGAARGIGQELMSIREQTPALFLTIAEGLGRIGVTANGTGGELRKLAEDGKLSAAQIAEAILAMGDDIDERFARIAPSIRSAFTVLRNTIIKSIGELSEKTGFGNEVGNAIFAVVDKVRQLTTELTPLLTRMADWMKANRETIVTIAKWGAGILAVGAVLTAFGAAIAGIGFAMGGLGTLIPIATVAAKGFALALGLIVAHPVVATLAATGTAMAIFARQSDEAAASLERYVSATQEAREKGDALRQVDDLRMQRLRQLSELQSLNSEEVAEARDLSKSLADRYGDLGLSIDGTTGALIGMAQAQERVNKAMQEASLREMDAEMLALQREMDALRPSEPPASGGLVGKFARDFGVLGGMLSEGIFGPDTAKAQREFEIRKRAQALQERMDKLRRGDMSGALGFGPQEVAPPTVSDSRLKAMHEGEEAAKRLTDIETEQSRARMSEYAKEIDAIRELAKEKRKLLEAIIAGERARPEGPHVDKLLAAEGALAVLDRETESRIGAVEGRRAAGQRDFRYGIEADRLRFELDQAEQRLAEAKTSQAKEAARDEIHAIQGRLQAMTANDWRRQRTAEARELFKDDPDGLTNAIASIDSLFTKMAEAPIALEKINEQFTTRGTFNAAAIQSLQSGAQDKIAKATQETAKNTKRIADRPDPSFA